MVKTHNNKGKHMKRVVCCFFSLLLILPLVIGIAPSIQWGDTPLKTNLPPVVITGKSTFKIIESRQIPIPSPFLPGSKERPSIVLSSSTAPEISEGGKRQPVPKSPGCAYHNAITTQVATLFKKDRAYDQRGKYLFLNRRYTEAIDIFQRLIATYPESRKIGEAYFWIGECYFQLEDTLQAEKFFKVSYKKYPSSAYADYAVYSLGWIFYRKGAYQKAAQYFKQGSLSYPNSPIYSHMLFWLAESYMKNGNIDAAERYFTKFLESSPDPSLKIPTLFELARIKFYKKEYRASKKILKTLLNLKISEILLPKIYLLMGWCEYFLDDPSGLKTFSRVMILPNISSELTEEAFYGKSLCALQQQKPGIAENLLKKLGPSSRWYGGVAIELANFYFNQKDYKRAGDFCTLIFQSYAKTPYIEKAYMILGNCAYNTKDYTHAAEYYTRVIMGKVDDLRPMAIFTKGLSFYQIGSFREAIDSWENLLKRYPKFPRRLEAIYWVGSAYLNLQKNKQAAFYFNQLKKDKVLYPKALMQLARYWFAQQSWRRALSTLHRFLQLYPHHVYTGYCKGMIGEIYFNLKNYPKAAQWVSKALKDPRRSKDKEFQAKLTFLLGQIAYRQGNFDGAIDYFDWVASKLPENAFSDKALYWKSMSYFSQRAYEKAVISFKAFVKKFPESSRVPNAYLKIADSYYNLRNYTLSNFYYQKASVLQKGENVKEKAAYGKILSFYQQKEFESFYRVAKLFIQTYPNSSMVMDVIQMLAEYYENQGETDKEVDLLEGFVKHHRASKQIDAIRFKLVKLYEKKGLYNSALVHLRVIAGKKGSTFRSLAEKELGDLYFKQKLYHEAIVHYRKYLNSEKPSPPIVREVRKQLIACLIITGAFQTAEKELKLGVKTFGSNWAAPLYLKLGKAYEKKGRYRLALIAFQTAQKSTNAGVKCKAMVYVSDVYLRRKKYDKTLKTLLAVRYSYPECRKLSERALLKLSILLGKKGKKDEAKQLLNMLVKSHDKNIKRLAKKALNQLH